MFIEQEHLSKFGLVRLRFNSTTGKLIEETLAGESKSATKRTHFFTMKNRDEDNYAILFSTDVPQFLDCRIYVAYFNNKHETIREVPINVDRKRYDYLRVVSAAAQPNGICISMSLAKLKENGTAPSMPDAIGTANIYDHQLFIYYIAKDSTAARSTSIDVSEDIYPYYANYTYNDFAKSLNLMLLSYREVSYKYGVMWLPAALISHIFFKVGEQDLALNYEVIRHNLVTKLLQQRTDTGKYYEGTPLAMFTNENGLTTYISTSYSRYLEPENNRRNNLYSYIGNIGITQIDDDGNEIGGALLPFAQRFMSHSHYYRPHTIANKTQSHVMFQDLPEQVYARQFISLNCYRSGKNIFILYNGNDHDISNISSSHVDTVYDCATANACYYKIDRKREITRHYLLGTPGNGEYKSCFLEGADFDEQRSLFASLVQYKKGDEVTLHMAWSHLE